MIIRLPEKSRDLERALNGKFWRVQTADGTLYIVNGKLPEGVASTLPKESCLDIKGNPPLT
ncbi:MAG TPA: hypothetical protein P5290_05800, partial [Candidatus Methanomethylicus sp.]|nr:hypothetical protein [Candidatus Methanomethylicus sp.]